MRIGREFLGLEYGFFMHKIHIYLKEMLFFRTSMAKSFKICSA